ncbi:MAG: DNA polymerase/3'-5' exonuclease PolX [Pseudobdellovibrionaceae bacterium]
MIASNSEIAQRFNLLADLLELQEANPFRVRAYRNAARTVLEIAENISELVKEEKDLTEYQGIGKDLAAKIKEIVETNHFPVLEEVQKKIPGGLVDLLRLPNLGPKRVKLLYQKLGIKSLTDLQKVLEDETILSLRGFGEKIRDSLIEELKKINVKLPSRKNLNQAQATVNVILKYLHKSEDVKRCSVAGSFRRQKETVGDLDFIVTADNGKKAIEHFLNFPSIAKILSRGSTKVTVVLGDNFQVDLRVVEDGQFGAALLYFTGSKAHNIALRRIARQRKMKINEYGVFKGKKLLVSKTESDIYRTLKMPYVEPELREDRGEIEAALNGTLPNLVELSDIQGDLHIHTNETDGKNSLHQMVTAAKQRGYRYIGITDHSQRIAMSHGLDEKRLRKQIEAIDKINSQQNEITVLKGIEVDILEDGSLDLSNNILSQLDFTVCSIHSKFRLSKKEQTERVLRAMKNPYFNIWGHPIGRLLESREPYELDMEKLIKAAAMYGHVLEVNAQPERMDLPDVYCRMAKRHNVKTVISTDAHSVNQLDFMKYGVSLARRGWLEKKDVINTLTAEELKKFFKGHKKHKTYYEQSISI